jgi:fermentation-respiration switch protein FrsA (DUF1100 family)
MPPDSAGPLPATLAALRPRPRRLARWTAIAAAALAAVLLPVLGVVGWIGSERAIHPAPKVFSSTPSDFPGLQPQSAVVHSRTGIPIAATFFPGSRRTTLVLSHGYGDNQALMLPYAAFLHQAGFSVLIYDMRSRGRSGGDAVTLGALEPLDLLSIIDYVARRPDVDAARIGALGVSLGGSTTLLAAARDTRIRAVVDDSGFSDAPAVIDSSFEHFIGLPAFPFGPVTVAIASRRVGVDVARIRPVDEVARISPRPLLIIHCLGDTVVPPLNSERIFAAAGNPKQLWEIPTGGHIAGHKVARQEYERRVSEFFENTLF